MGLKTIVEFMDGESPYECGYCSGADTAVSNGMWAHQMTPQDYQDLIDRNWRRSGKYCYKPVMDRTCCPLYMIRCDAVNYALSRSHKKVIKKVNRFLSTGVKGKTAAERSEAYATDSDEVDDGGGEADKRKPPGDATLAAAAVLSPSSSSEPRPPLQDHCGGGAAASSEASSRPPLTNTGRPVGANATDGALLRPCKKAKALRLERKLKKLADRGLQADSAQLQVRATKQQQKAVAKTMEELMDEYKPSESRHVLEVQLIQSFPMTTVFEATLDKEYSVYKRYQMAVHGDTEDKCTKPQFEKFLVVSPLMPEPAGTPGVIYGSFHCQYWLDGNIIAVEVMDILPHCVSSKYFFYDPDYDFLNLGTYSALRAMRLTRALQERLPALRYYLMGFYVHSCAKMRYKAGFRPSYLLCPEAYTWVPLADCVPKLDASKCCRLEPDAELVDREQDGLTIADVLCACGRHALRYGQLQELLPGQLDDEQEVDKYARLVGRTLSQRMLLVRH